jgi:ketosteroid isomerase-like protein
VHKDIEKVVGEFKSAIVNKDKAAFLSLFYSGTVSWVGVISEETKAMLVDKDPRFAQQPRIMPGTPAVFIDGIAANEYTTREDTENLRIYADGNVANVIFDYTLYKNDVLHNWGKENWQLIYTTDGWKINAVNFSYTMNPALFRQSD